MGQRHTSGVYVIENLANGKKYVGSSAHLDKRWGEHLSALRRGKHSSPHLQYAFQKYGREAFVFRVLFLCDPASLDVFEQRAADVLRPEYNTNPITKSCLGARRSEATRSRMSAAQKLVKGTPEWRAWFSERIKGNKYGAGKHNLRGRKHTAETRAKMSETSRRNKTWTGRKHTAETRAKLSAINTGKRPSEETLAKMSASQLARRERMPGDSPETRAKKSAAQLGNKKWLGKKHTPETIAKMAATHRLLWAARRANALGKDH